MRFTTSSSKWALVRSDLRRFWPLLFGYAVLWLCAMPVALWSHRDYARTLDHVRVLCDIVNSYFSNGGIVAAAIVPACFTVLLAMALFSYLMNSRSVGLMHSLPITRGAQFGVHFAVGVGMFTAVHVVTALISLPVQAALGAVDLQGTLEWLAVAEVSGLLFFSLSTLCAMVTGWLLAIPVIYAGVNFLFAAFYLLYSAITQIFCWGYEASGWPGWLDWLTPTVRLLWQVTDSKAVLYGLNDRGFHCYVDRLSSGAWTTLAVYLAVAVLLAAVAYCFYRARHSETAGDAIVFPWLRPVVLYVIALAGGMGLGILLWYMISAAKGLAALLVYQIVSGLIVYFGVQMLLHKSFRVFTRRGWIGAAALAVALVVIGLAVRFDALGVSRYVPDADQVESVSFGSYYQMRYVDNLTDEEAIAQVIALHEAVLAQGEPTENEMNQAAEEMRGSSADVDQETIEFCYQMKNGGFIRRRFTQIIRRDTPLYEQMNRVYNMPVVRKVLVNNYFSVNPDITVENITGGWFNNYKLGGDSVELTGAQARQLFTAVQRYLDSKIQTSADVLDFSESNVAESCFMLQFNYTAAPDTDNSRGNATTRAELGDSNGGQSWVIDCMPGDCTELMDLLISFGLADTRADLMYD